MNRKLSNWERLKNDASYKFAEQEVYKRDKCCRICKSVTDLTIHHIKSRKEYPWLAADEDNMIVVCRNCHTNIHRSKHSNRKVNK